MTASGRASGTSEGGAVLVVAVWVAAILAVGVTALATRTVADVRAVEASVARAAALHAAESAVSELIDRLERDAFGWTDPRVLSFAQLEGGPAPLDIGPTSVAARDLPDVTLAVTAVGAGPTLRLEATARVRGQRRSVRAVVRPASVADLALGVVHAVLDPDVTGGTIEDCALPRWVSAAVSTGPVPVEPEVATPAAPCIRTRFDPSRTVRGPIHVDDRPRIDGGWVGSGPLTSSAPPVVAGAGPAVLTPSDVTDVAGPSGLRAAPPLQLPGDPFAASGDAVCHLRGPTVIRLHGDRVRIRSPRSHPRHDGDGGPPVSCEGIDPTLLDGVVEVQLDGAATLEVRRDPGARCAVHPLGIDVAEDAVVAQRCGDGTAYVWGSSTRDRTVLAEDDVNIVWNLLPEPDTTSGSDGPALAVVAGGSVVVRRPVGPPLRTVAPFGTDVPVAGPGLAPFGAYPQDAPSPVPVRWESPRIVATIAALGGSFRLQNHARGQWSDIPIVVDGAVVQRFEGPMSFEHRDATGALQARTGRPLEIVHDGRLEVRVPPALPRLRGGRLRVLSWEEVSGEVASGAG